LGQRHARDDHAVDRPAPDRAGHLGGVELRRGPASRPRAESQREVRRHRLNLPRGAWSIQAQSGTLATPSAGKPIMIKRTVVFLLLAATAGLAFAQAPQQWTEGKDYFAIQNPQPTDQPAKVVVTEV